MNTIALRPAAPADDEFCFQLHKAAMGAYVATIWGWEDTAQREYHARAFAPEFWKIITVDGKDVGVLIVEDHTSEIYLARIEIDPDHQGRGIGAYVIHQLLDDARSRGQHLVLDVLAVNGRALAFYLRHGFREIGRHGPDNIKVRLRSV